MVVVAMRFNARKIGIFFQKGPVGPVSTGKVQAASGLELFEASYKLHLITSACLPELLSLWCQAETRTYHTTLGLCQSGRYRLA